MKDGKNMRRDPWTECIIKASDERGEETVADSIIDAFLGKIVQDREIDAKVAYEILSARGFLLDFNNNNYKLSNNSHNDDRAFFRELRKIVRYRENHQYKYHNWTWIFKFPKREETVNTFWPTTWEYFWQREYGDKISVAKLDPFIARLVKSFSSIGLFTWISCDGHGKFGSYVVFNGIYSASWFDVIFNEFIKKKIRLRCHWKTEHFENPGYNSDFYILQIWHPKNDYVDLYMEIQDVARLLYENRIVLRKIKKDMVNNIWINENYLYKLFKKNSDFANLFEPSTKQKQAMR